MLMSQGTFIWVSKANKLVRCRRCQKEGHYARGCKANVTSETPWEKGKRVQKEKSASFYNFFFIICKMPITNTINVLIFGYR